MKNAIVIDANEVRTILAEKVCWMRTMELENWIIWWRKCHW